MNQEIHRPRERRHSHRVEVQFPVESVLLGNALAGVRRFSTESLDLSEGGAKIRVPEELPLGQRLGTHHQGRARVLRSSPRPEQVGERGAWAAVQFVEPGLEMRTAVAELIGAAERDRTDRTE